jgi:hypothetical protein
MFVAKPVCPHPPHFNYTSSSQFTLLWAFNSITLPLRARTPIRPINLIVTYNFCPHLLPHAFATSRTAWKSRLLGGFFFHGELQI